MESPGTGRPSLQVPPDSSAMNGRRFPYPARLTWPTAAQLPGEPQDTELTSILVPSDIPCRPMTCCSGPHVPFFSSAANAWAMLEESVNHPAAAQLPGAAGPGGQETERASVLTPL